MSHRLLTFGITRGTVINDHGVEKLRIIPDTVMCEDVHLEHSTQQLFTACQDDAAQHTQWFPPMVVLTNPKALSGGSIVRVDPATFTSTKLALTNFTGPFVTHGIDIMNDPVDPNVLWIYIVSHLPNPERYDVDPPIGTAPERPHIEIFRHELGSDEAVFMRSVRHPLIAMPNDLLIESPTSFYVTSDHVYHEGMLRLYEDFSTQWTGPSAPTIHVKITDLYSKDPTAGLRTTVALKGIHNNNGLGRGRPGYPEETIIIDAAGGVMWRTKRPISSSEPKMLQKLESIQMDSTLDNPFYYDDPYATAANNASGYLLPGMLNAGNGLGDFAHLDRPISSVVWHVRAVGTMDFESGSNKWEKKALFQDDGSTLRSASGSAMLPIDPSTNEGKKQAWLFVTGFGSLAMVAAKVDL